jgi:threonine synthase
MTTTTSTSTTTTTDLLVSKQLQSISETLSKLDSETEKDKFVMELRRGLLETKNYPSAMGSARIASNIVDCIGQTPLVRINKLFSDKSPRGEVVAKLEYTNPALSVKDRIAREMILDAQAAGTIRPNHTIIVDITSGNTGVAYGIVAAALGYKSIQIIPQPYSVERRAMMMATGVEVIVSRKEDGILGAIKVYNEILQKYGTRAWAPRQFDNGEFKFCIVLYCAVLGVFCY